MSLGDTTERPAARPRPPRSRTAQALVVRFAGDSGDGVQLAGHQFATAAAAEGADLMTLPEFPAEIRAPAGTTFGVSAYQVQFGAGEVLTPGDEADVLVAFNPAAFVTNIQFLKPGGTVVYDEGAFNERAYIKAGLAGNPVDQSGEAPYRAIPVAITQRTLEAVAEFGLGRKDGSRAKNFWALGLSLWLCGQSPDATTAWIEQRFAKDPALLGGNRAALKAGYAYGETMELVAPRGRRRWRRRTAAPDRSRMISGTDAMALGVAAAGALAGRPVFYCSYPITPASALLHALAKMKAGVRTFQAEDEIAAVCSAIGAVLCRWHRRDRLVRTGTVAEDGGARPCRHGGAAAHRDRRAARRPFDRHADQAGAVRSRHGRLRPPRRSAAPGSRAGDAGRLLRHHRRRREDRDRGDDAGHRAVRRLSRQRRQRLGGALDRRASRFPRPQRRPARSPPSPATPRRSAANGWRRERPASFTASAAWRRIRSPATSPTTPTTTSRWCG